MSEAGAAATDGRESTRLDAFLALCQARFREFYRESEVVFWSFVFPIVLSVGLGIAFRNRPAETLPVAVVAGPSAARLTGVLARAPLLKAAVMDEDEATRALRLGRVAVVVTPRADGGVEYRLDPSRSESAIARARADDALQRAAGRRDLAPARDEPVTEPGSRFIDFLPALYFLGVMSALVSQRGQRVGDLLAGVVLVRDEPVALGRYDSPPPGAPPAANPELAGPPLSPRDAELVLSFLERGPSFDPAARQRLARRMVERFGAHLAPEDRARLVDSLPAAEGFLRQRARAA